MQSLLITLTHTESDFGQAYLLAVSVAIDGKLARIINQQITQINLWSHPSNNAFGQIFLAHFYQE